jgi:hypothetical protein
MRSHSQFNKIRRMRSGVESSLSGFCFESGLEGEFAREPRPPAARRRRVRRLAAASRQNFVYIDISKVRGAPIRATLLKVWPHSNHCASVMFLRRAVKVVS